ncbi:DUF7563 family protein [Natrinema ejinorense]|uniref:DUF7563 family protein n=1 Tax=Natrinema ejinorense TaxID=373386 RepID=UPI003742B7EB
MVGVAVVPWPSVDNSRCEHCGDHVTDRFRRVFGDDDLTDRCGDAGSRRPARDGLPRPCRRGRYTGIVGACERTLCD